MWVAWKVSQGYVVPHTSIVLHVKISTLHHIFSVTLVVNATHSRNVASVQGVKKGVMKVLAFVISVNSASLENAITVPIAMNSIENPGSFVTYVKDVMKVTRRVFSCRFIARCRSFLYRPRLLLQLRTRPVTKVGPYRCGGCSTRPSKIVPGV